MGLRQRRAALALVASMLAVGLGVLIWLLLDGPLPLRIIAVGVSAYDDPAMPLNTFGDEDAEALYQFSSQAATSELTALRLDDALTRSALLRFLDGDAADLRGQNLLFFCSLYGQAVSPRGDSDRTQADLLLRRVPGQPDERISTTELLQKLKGTGAENVLVLIDASRAGANWRLGGLANDLVACIESDLKDLENEGGPHIQVICAAGPLERSWGDFEHRQSAFVRFVLEALQGAADGWDEEGDAGSRDGSVSSNELYWYVRRGVDSWSQKHRGLPQKVVRLGSAASFELLAARPDSVLSRIQASPEDQAEETPSDDANTDVAAASGSAERVPPDAGSGTTPTGTSKDATKPGQKQDPPAAADAKQPKPKSAEERLAELWRLRDELRKPTGREGVFLKPVEWREAQQLLLRAERQIRSGRTDKAEEPLLRAEGLLTTVKSAKDIPAPAELSDAAPLTLALAVSQLTAEQREALEAHFQAVRQVTEENLQPLDDCRKFLKETPGAGPELVRRVVAQATETPTRGDLQTLRQVIDLVPKSAWTSELVFVDRLVRLAAASGDSNEEWPEEYTALCKRALESRRATEEALARASSLAATAPLAETALRAAIAEEEWLLRSNRRPTSEAERWLQETGSAQDALDRACQSLREARLLRAEILAELPDYAYWAAESAELDPPGSSGRVAGRELIGLLSDGALQTVDPVVRRLPEHEQQLIETMLRLRGLESLLARASERLDLDTLRRETDALARAWNGFLETFQRLVAVLSNPTGAASADERRRIETMLALPWLPEARRQSLWARLVSPQTIVSAPLLDSNGTTDRTPAGEWHAFWAIQVLSLAGAQNTDLWQMWTEYAKSDTETPDPNEIEPAGRLLGRVRLGEEIRSAWDGLVRDGAPGRETDDRLARSLVGTEIRGRRELIADDRLRDLQQVLELRRAYWTVQQQQAAGYGPLVERAGTAIAKLARQTGAGGTERHSIRSLAAGIVGVPEYLELNLQRKARLALAVQRETGADDDLELYFDSPNVDVVSLTDGAKGRPIGPFDPVPAGTGRTAREYEITLRPGTVGPTGLLVALVDGKDRFPLAIHQMTVQPPIDPDKWRIVFLAGPNEDENVRHTSYSGWTEFRIPPSDFNEPTPYGLTPWLVRPNGDPATTARMRVFARLEDGTTSRTPLFEPQEIRLPAGGERVPLTFSLPSAPKNQADGAADPAKTPPAAPAAPAGVDISRGLVFEFETTAAGSGTAPKTFTLAVQPNYWTAGKFIEEPVRPSFDTATGQISVEVRRRAIDDPLLPETVPVELQLIGNWDEDEIVNRDTEGELGPGQQRRLLVELRRGSRMFDRPDAEIALSIAGLPHTHRWPLRSRGRSPDVRLRIAEPGNGAVLTKGEAYRIRLDIESADLETRARSGGAWLLQTELLAAGQRPGEGGKETWNVWSPLEKRFVLQGVEEGQWLIHGAARDFQKEVAARREGRFEMRARLIAPGGGAVAEDTIVLAFDSKDSPPSDPTFTGLPAAIELRRDPLSFRVSSEDPHSGIRTLSAGIDVNGDGMLSPDDDRLAPGFPYSVENPLKGTGGQSVPVVFHRDDLADLPPKRYNLIAIAENGHGTMSKPAKASFVLKAPPKPVVPTTGSLEITATTPSRGGYTWALAGPESKSMKAGGATHVFRDLKPGNYTVTVKDSQRSGTGTGTVTAGKTTPVRVEMRLGAQ